jgi:HEAT repeat protein
MALRSSAVIALARLAPLLTSDQRQEAASVLRKALPRESHWLVEGLGNVALGSLLAADAAAGSDRLLTETDLERHLFREAKEGNSLTRPFAALALGVALHGLVPATRTLAVFRTDATRALTRGLEAGHGADDVVGAYAVALGLAGADAARPQLLAVLKNVNRGAGLRGHCALALGQIGNATPEDVAVLTDAMEERLSSFVHVQSAAALAILGAPEARPRLLHQLQDKHARDALAAVASALGRLRDPAATEALLALAKGRSPYLNVRTMSVAALGLIYDPELRPSRVRFTRHANYPSRTPSLSQLFDII